LLGHIDASTYTIKTFGAIHSARWMGSLLAGLKAELLKKHVPVEVLSPERLRGLRRINKLMTHIIIRYWFKATHSADAPFNQLELVKELTAYTKIDK
jgi:hypothetical protein